MNKQKYEKIRVISATVNGDIFAVAEWDKNIQIWDVKNGLVSKFSTDIVSGMSKAISISEDGKQLAIAGYNKKTVTLFNADNGDILWQRKDIKKPSTAMILNHNPNLIFIDTENQGAFFLDKKTGETVEKLKGVLFLKENPYSKLDQYVKSSTSTIVNRIDQKTIKSFTHKSFALLDSCFSTNKIICSYAGNVIEAISLDTFETIWSTKVLGHFLEIEFSKELNKILGIRWDFEKGGPKYLCFIDIEKGNVEKEINLEEPIKIEFLKQGSLILTSQGKLYSAFTGQLLKEFDFENE